MANTAEHITKVNAGTLAKNGKAVEQIAKANAEVLAKSGSAAVDGFQELTKAYHALATRNAAKLTASIQALSAVKSPIEFVELQRKLITEGVNAAVSDCSNIAQLTAAVFAAAFEPVRKQVEVLQDTVKN